MNNKSSSEDRQDVRPVDPSVALEADDSKPPTEAKSSRPWLVRVSLDFLDKEITPLSEEAKHIFLILECFARNHASCWPGNKRIERLTGKRERALRVLYGELERAGWIRRVQGMMKRDGFILLKRSNPLIPTIDEDQAVEKAKNDMLQTKADPSHLRQKTAESNRQNFAAEESFSAASKPQKKMKAKSPPPPRPSAYAGSGGETSRKKTNENQRAYWTKWTIDLIAETTKNGKILDHDEIACDVYSKLKEALDEKGVDPDEKVCDEIWSWVEKALDDRKNTIVQATNGANASVTADDFHPRHPAPLLSAIALK